MDRSRFVAEAKSASRTNALFKAMSTDYLLREQFATDPAQVLINYVQGAYPTQASTDTTNQLIFAVLSCSPLRRWMDAVGRREDHAQLSRHSFAVEFAKAAAASGDYLVTLALIRSASDKEGEFMARLDLLRWITGAMGAGTTGFSVEMSSGDTVNRSSSTEMIPDFQQHAELVRDSLRNVEHLSDGARLGRGSSLLPPYRPDSLGVRQTWLCQASLSPSPIQM
ncbi:hypothetical protein [Pseudomonas sp. F01002]|uniref:hypothetical protein n=1 Tax=Pseudomonas sp. F01002 TaxID=2555724 RepID=UPI00106B0E9D|nr:hypothetical protein [Pseudomonas sp. F01002]TFB42270.1 hypothetical protein E3W21_09155 [Pseudomonas sp. F01002]